MKNITLAIVLCCVAALAIASCNKEGAPAAGNSNYAKMHAANANFIEEVINKGNLDAADKFLAADFIDHGPPDMGIKGIKGFKEEFGKWFNCFTDLHSDTVAIVVDGNDVVTIIKSRATWTKDFMGMKATGKSAKDILEMHYSKMNDSGLCTEHWGLSDMAGMMAQFEMKMPSAPPPGAAGDTPPAAGAPAAAAPAAGDTSHK